MNLNKIVEELEDKATFGCLAPEDVLEALKQVQKETLETSDRELEKIKKENSQLRAVHHLWANEEIFARADRENQGFFCMVTDGFTKDGVPTWEMAINDPKFALNLSDTFYYACADCEEFEYADAEELWNIAQKEGYNGLINWAIAKRKAKGEHCEPIAPVKKRMDMVDESWNKAIDECINWVWDEEIVSDTEGFVFNVIRVTDKLKALKKGIK